jgi:Leucine-rich repeat (LRR) protein
MAIQIIQPAVPVTLHLLALALIDQTIKAVYTQRLGPQAGWGSDFFEVNALQRRVVTVFTALAFPVLYFYYFRSAVWILASYTVYMVYSLIKKHDHEIHGNRHSSDLAGLISIFSKVDPRAEIQHSMLIFAEAISSQISIPRNFFIDLKDLSKYDLGLQLNRWLGRNDRLLSRIQNVSLRAIRHLPKQISVLTELSKLEFRVSGVSDLTPLLQNEELRYLGLTGSSSLKTVPEDLFLLKNLSHLDLSQTGITSFPLPLSKCTSIRHLNLSMCKFNELPQTASLPPNLTYLNLSETNISVLPESINELIHLQELQFGSSIEQLGNDRLRLPSVLPKSLRKVNLTRNSIKKLPTCFEHCELLEELNLSLALSCRYSEAIKLPSNLKILDLSLNSLTAVPPSILQCNQLEKLNLSHNNIRELTAEECFPPSLKRIDLKGNLLRILPGWLLARPITCDINIEDNPVEVETIALMQQSILIVREATGRQFGATLRTSHVRESFELLAENVLAQRNQAQLSVNVDELILNWLNEFQQEYPQFCENKAERFPTGSGEQQPCLVFYNPLRTHPKSQELGLFLHGLKATADYKEGGNSRKVLIYHTFELLEEAALNPKFCVELFDVLYKASARCHDRETFVFNRVHVLIRLYRSGAQTDTELIQLLIGCKRIELLHKCADERIDQFAKTDLLEVYLYYECNLKNSLKLPLSTQGMIYKETGKVPDEILQEDANQVIEKTKTLDDICQLLLEQPVWLRRMEEKYQEGLRQIREELSFQIEKLDCDTELSKKEKETAYSDLQSQHDINSQEFILEKTKDLVAKNIHHFQTIR